MFAVLSVLANRAALSQGSPPLAILARWCRWFFMAFLITLSVQLFMSNGIETWRVFVAGLLGWFLLESIYAWLLVNVVSGSDLPLFPRFRRSASGDSWPIEEQWIQLKEWARKAGFERRDMLSVSLDGEITLRVSVLDQPAEQIRMLVYLIPNQIGTLMSALAFHTDFKDGKRVVTDNFFIPFGGFYPENWEVARMPRERNPQRLLDRHKSRCKEVDAPVAELNADPMEGINRDQQRVELLNRQLGFLNSIEEEEEVGRISGPGRYRVWRDMLLQNYLGTSLRY